MKRVARGKVGSKGELFPPKELRERLGLEPGSRVAYRLEDNRLVVEPVPSLEQVMSMPPRVTMSLRDVRKTRRELSREAER